MLIEAFNKLLYSYQLSHGQLGCDPRKVEDHSLQDPAKTPEFLRTKEAKDYFELCHQFILSEQMSDPLEDYYKNVVQGLTKASPYFQNMYVRSRIT